MFYTYRSVKDFRIQVSDCPYDWKTVVEDTLENGIGQNCQTLPLRAFTPNAGTVIGRYVRFVVVSKFGESATLNYFFVDFEDPSTVEQNVVLCYGKVDSKV